MNLLNREFTVTRPLKMWVSDITYIATAKGLLYFSVVIDLYSRKVVGWSMSAQIRTNLVLQALILALIPLLAYCTPDEYKRGTKAKGRINLLS